MISVMSCSDLRRAPYLCGACTQPVSHNAHTCGMPKTPEHDGIRYYALFCCLLVSDIRVYPYKGSRSHSCKTRLECCRYRQVCLLRLDVDWVSSQDPLLKTGPFNSGYPRKIPDTAGPSKIASYRGTSFLITGPEIP